MPNSKVFWRVFAILTIIETCFLLSGCTSAWLSAVSGLLPAISAVVNAVVAFVAALEGKTVSASFLATIQKWQQNIASEISNAQTIIASLQQSASTSLISQFQTVMQSVLTQFTSILSGVDITDSATVAKLTQFVGLGVAAVNAVLALLPLALSKLESKAPEAELKHYDSLGAAATKNAVKVMKETYAAIRSEHTSNADVNAALDALPSQI